MNRKDLRKDLKPILFGLLFFLGVGAKFANAEAEIPRAAHYAALEKVSDCHLYGTVLKEQEFKSHQNQSDLSTILITLKQLRGDFEECARAHGVSRISSDEEESRAVFFCTDSYEMWLKQGMQYELAREDLKNAQESSRELQHFIKFRCSAFALASFP